MTDRLGLTAQEHMGFWWLPEDPDRTVGGRLSFAPADGLRLDLVGVLGSDDPYEKLDVVLGTTIDGEPITLESVQRGGRRTVSSIRLPATVISETLHLQFGYVGGHLPSPDQRTFATAILGLDDLAGWMGTRPFEEDFGPEPVRFSVSYQHPAVVRAEADFGEIEISHSAGVFGDGLHERGLRASVAFVVRLREPRGIDWWLQRIVRALQDLLTLVADRPSSVTRLAFVGEAGDIAVLYEPAGPDHLGRPLYHHEFLFHPAEVAEQMPTILARWFELTTELAPVVDFLIATRYRPSYVENRFLNVVSALEAYHRRRYPNAVLPKAEHDVRQARILGAVSEEDRNWLSERLAYSNEPSLRSRLGDLLGRGNNDFLRAILGSDDLIKPCVDLRNRLIHQDPRRSRTAVEPSALWSVTEKLTLLLLTCLLDDLGFSGPQLHEVIVGSARFRQLVEADRWARGARRR